MIDPLFAFPARVLKAVFQASEQAELKKISELDDELQKIARIADAQIQQQTKVGVYEVRTLFENLSARVENLNLKCPQVRLVDTSSIYSRTLEEELFLHLLTWLSSVPYSQHHARRSEERLPGSTQWLFQHPEYISWKAESRSSIMLLHAIQGSGKTCLCSAVIDAFLDDKRKNILAAPVAYFYCGDSKFGRDRAKADEILRSLTRQLAVIDRTAFKVHEHISLEYERRVSEARLDGFEVPKLRSSECADLILQTLGSNPAVIIIDAIDEVDESQKHELLEAVIRIRDESASVVKIFLTSRDDSRLFSWLPDVTKLRIEESDTHKDIETFAQHRISLVVRKKELLGGSVSSSIQEDLVQSLIQRAGESFLWVNLQIEGLCKLQSTKSVLTAMHDRSKVTNDTITALYADILAQVCETDITAYEIASTAFRWLMCMNEPMSSATFLTAVSRSLSTTDDFVLTASELQAICSNLIVLDSKLNTFRFSHATFKEFLEGKEEFTTAHANQTAAVGCLETCINHPLSDLSVGLHPDQNFELYSIMYWPTHYMAGITTENLQDLQPRLGEFAFYDNLETSMPFLYWLEAADTISQSLPRNHALKKDLNAVMSPAMTPLFTACIYGMECLLQVVCRWQDFAVDLPNSLGHTGLYLAAASGRSRVVSSLLEMGADVNIQCGRHGSILYAACFGGHVDVVQQLLSHQAAAPSLDDLQAALQASFLAGHEDVARLLLQNELIVSSQEQYDNHFAAACQAGFANVAEYLTSRFPAYRNTPTTSNHRFINAAIAKGQAVFLKKYINQGLLPDDVVATAALFGQTQIALMCLESGSDIEKEGIFGTPFRAASFRTAGIGR